MSAKYMRKPKPYDVTALPFGELRKHCDRLGLKPAGKKRSDYLDALGVRVDKPQFSGRKPTKKEAPSV